MKPPLHFEQKTVVTPNVFLYILFAHDPIETTKEQIFSTCRSAIITRPYKSAAYSHSINSAPEHGSSEGVEKEAK